MIAKPDGSTRVRRRILSDYFGKLMLDLGPAPFGQPAIPRSSSAETTSPPAGRPLPDWRPPPALALFLLALALRLGFLASYGPLLLPDSCGRYLPIAEGLFGQWRGSVFDTPGYPAFIALLKPLPRIWLYLVQDLLDSLSVVWVFKIFRALGMNRGAIFGALFFAVHAGAMVFANAALSETLFTFLLLAAVCLFTRLDRNARWPAFLPIGLLIGMVALTRANGMLVLLVFAVVISITRFRVRPFGSAPALLAMLIAALIPVGGWIKFNGQSRQVYAIAQGGGWQWLQNMAYFGLIDSASLPPGEAQFYEGWESLGSMRDRLFADPAYRPEEIDPLLGNIARTNASARPWSYLAAVPSALRLPRRFIKNITRLAVRPDEWREAAREAAAGGCAHAMNSDGSWPRDLFRPLFILLRILTIIPGKYSLMGLALFPALIIAWRRRHARLVLVFALPLSQFLVLLFMLNPIERYFFPFEAMMVAAFCLVVQSWRDRFGARQVARTASSQAP